MSLHSILLRSTDFWLHRRPTPNIATSATTSSTTYSFDAPFQTSCRVPSDIGHRRLKASLRSARLQDLLEVGPARLLAAMLGDLGVSALLCTSFDQDHYSHFFSF
jgi:hypothetical protein